MTRTKPRVSFVVPSYNYARFVTKAVDSLLEQDFESLEVIVIDDCSTDATQQVLRAYEGEARVKLVRHSENKGHIGTYNEGLAMAAGEFIGLLSADDICLRSDAVARQVALFEGDPDVGMVYSPLAYINSEGRLVSVVRRWNTDSVHDGLVEFRDLAFTNFIPASGTLVRASCHLDIGYYDPRLRHAGDWDLWLRLAARYRVGYVADAMYGWRLHDVNMHTSSVTPGQADHEHVLTLTRAFDALPSSAPAEVRALRQPSLLLVAIRAIDQERRWDRVGAAWGRAWLVVRQHPVVVTDVRFLVATTKLAIRSMLGGALVRQVLAFRRRSSLLPAQVLHVKSE
jgi:cellulose synthase/poly-beta-1,6-N-acetylglucosamine synthase-like glycosyltransferase